MTIKHKASMYVEQGTVYTPVPPLENAMHRLKTAAMKKERDIHIFSGNDSDHQMNSFHYDNRAVDFELKSFMQKEIYEIVNNVNVEDEIYYHDKKGKFVQVTHYFDVIKYLWGWHIEYQPRKN